MEKEGQKWEQEEVKAEEEEEEASQLVRKSRAGNDDSKLAPVGVEVSNGNGEHNDMIEELNNNNGVLGNGSEAINGEQKIEEELENESEAINYGEHKSNNLVFYDKVEGKWKCRICSWNGSVCSDHFQSHKGQLHKLMSVKNLIFETQGIESPKASATNGADLKNKTLFSSSLEPCQISDEEHNSGYIKSSNEIESAEADLINEDDVDETDYDVERVIQKQNTHDLYCPNCNSCITKRVILRKRKRGVRITDEEAKRNKLEAGVAGFKIGASSGHEPSGQTDEVGVGDPEIQREVKDDDDERSRGPAIFKCLSCFSIFIPTRKGFKLLFGDKSGKESVGDEQVTRVNRNWFISLFASNKQDSAGIIAPTNVQQGDQSGQPSLVQNTRSPTGEDNSLPQKSSVNGKVITGGGAEKIEATMELFETYTGDELEYRKEIENEYSVIRPPKGTQVTNGESSEDGISVPKEDGLKFSNKGSADQGMDGQLNISVAIPHQEQDVRATIQTDSVVENKYTNFKSSKSGRFYPTEMSQHTVTETKFELHSGEPLKFDNISSVNGASVGQGKDAVITIDPQPAEPSQTMQGTIRSTESARPLLSATQIITTDGERSEARKETEIEVVKSIVYGGLAESITSLSVVSSAAGGGAATLNILALGMASLIGGLFIICHNLWELKSDRIAEASNQISDQVPKQRDRYKQLLGRRENFILHSVVAIMSYIIFGLVPPLVYGFSFRKTDDKEFKLLVVAASSLLCIVLLATGRAYVRTPPKPYLQSVTTYVILGFMVSGVSFAAGKLFDRLLEKLGLFESGSVSNLLLSEMAKEGTGWASF